MRMTYVDCSLDPFKYFRYGFVKVSIASRHHQSLVNLFMSQSGILVSELIDVKE